MCVKKRTHYKKPMRIFSLKGIIMLVVYVVALDRAATMIPAIAYVSPFGTKEFDLKVAGVQSVVPIAIAFVLVVMTPNFF